MRAVPPEGKIQRERMFFLLHICSVRRAQQIRRPKTARCQGARSASWQRISAFIKRQPDLGEKASTSVKQGKLLDTGDTTATLQRKATDKCARERQVHQQHEPYAGGAATMKQHKTRAEQRGGGSVRSRVAAALDCGQKHGFQAGGPLL